MKIKYFKYEFLLEIQISSLENLVICLRNGLRSSWVQVLLKDWKESKFYCKFYRYIILELRDFRSNVISPWQLIINDLAWETLF